MTYISVTGLTFGNALRFNQDCSIGADLESDTCFVCQASCSIHKGLLPRIMKSSDSKIYETKKADQMQIAFFFFWQKQSFEMSFGWTLTHLAKFQVQIHSLPCQTSHMSLVQLESNLLVAPVFPPLLLPQGDTVREGRLKWLFKQLPALIVLEGKSSKPLLITFAFINTVYF